MYPGYKLFFTCIPCRRLHVGLSCIGDKIVVTATRIGLLVSGYELLVWDNCIWLHVSDVNSALQLRQLRLHLESKKIIQRNLVSYMDVGWSHKFTYLFI